MPVTKLTILSVQKAIAIDARDTVYRDTEIKGFSLKVTPAGSKIYFYQYRIGGRAGVTRKIKIGAFPTIRPDEARKIATEYAGELARNNDPQQRIKNDKILKVKNYENSFSRLLELYDLKQLKQNRSGSEVKRIFEREFLPTLKNTPIKSIEKSDISQVIDRIYARKKYHLANRALRCIKTFFRWALSEGYVTGDPTSGMKKPYKNEVSRDRVLTPSEIKLLWDEFLNLGRPFGDALRVLLLTAQRRDEVSTMQWRDIDLASGLWLIPPRGDKKQVATSSSPTSYRY